VAGTTRPVAVFHSSSSARLSRGQPTSAPVTRPSAAAVVAPWSLRPGETQGAEMARTEQSRQPLGVLNFLDAPVTTLRHILEAASGRRSCGHPRERLACARKAGHDRFNRHVRDLRNILVG
jgi:hypothetical protein